jgi:uncharacterized membrane protein YhfC
MTCQAARISMRYVTYILNFSLMIALPIALGVFLTRRFKLGWGLWGVGAVTFILSQVVHRPLNAGLTRLFAQGLLPAPPEDWALWFNAIVLGLTAGLSEETARYLVYRLWIRDARTWREALMFGAGHGGIEAIILGGLAALTTLQLFALRGADLSTFGLSAEQLLAVQRQLEAFWSAPWYATLLGALERAFTLCFHLSAAVLVLQAFTRKNLLWLGAAILWHALVDAAAVYAIGVVGPYWTEALIALFAVVSVGLIFALKPVREEAAPEWMTLPSTAPAQAADPESALRHKMDETRFSS